VRDLTGLLAQISGNGHPCKMNLQLKSGQKVKQLFDDNSILLYIH
jgi:hypothetical protein